MKHRAPYSLILCSGLSLALMSCSEKQAESIAETAPDSAEAAPPAPAQESPQVAVAPVVAETPPVGGETTPVAAPPPVAVGPASGAGMEKYASEEKAFADWCKRYFLDANDPTMLDGDNDGDGFANREEFIGDSDPLNPNSRPGIHGGMRLQKYNEVRLPVVLDEVKGDKAFLKQLEGGEEKSEVVKAGDSIRGMKVGRVITRRETDKTGQPIDVSRVTLEDETTKERVTLVKGMPARTAATHAVLVSPDGDTSITVKQGETFEWPGAGGQAGAHYTVVDMSDDQVVVQQVENGKMWTIPKQ